MATTTQKPLEERAKELLIWKITRNGKTPNPFAELEEFTEELQFLIDRGYVVERGGTPKSLSYAVTPEGRKYALGKQ